MGANLKHAFVIDVEATCWATREEQGDRPNEIIEIGVAQLDLREGQVVVRSSIAVKPRFTKVSAFCTELTGWTQADVDEGLDIVEALEAFKFEYNPTRDHVWFSYGEYDRIKLSSVTGKAGLNGLYGIKREENPFDLMRGHFNAKTLMALRFKLDREMGMDKALKYLRIPLVGRHHNGADDAYNIAQIVARTLS
jgi:inhibitor of KinA sporulation pathway (predicted exonuclease)